MHHRSPSNHVWHKPDAPDGSSLRTIWKGVSADCLEKGRPFQIILGRWLSITGCYSSIHANLFAYVDFERTVTYFIVLTPNPQLITGCWLEPMSDFWRLVSYSGWVLGLAWVAFSIFLFISRQNPVKLWCQFLIATLMIPTSIYPLILTGHELQSEPNLTWWCSVNIQIMSWIFPIMFIQPCHSLCSPHELWS